MSSGMDKTIQYLQETVSYCLVSGQGWWWWWQRSINQSGEEWNVRGSLFPENAKLVWERSQNNGGLSEEAGAHPRGDTGWY